MERYINSFATENDIQIALENGELLKPYVAYIEDADRIDWNSKNKIVDYTTEYLTFNILSAGTINWTANNTALTKIIDYKLNDNEWVSITSNTGSSAPSITVNSGDKLQFRGNNTAYSSVNVWGDVFYNSFKSSTVLFEAEGNIMSLVNSTGFATATTLSSAYMFRDLFFGCTGLTSAENLILPATTLANYCYDSMFNGCTSLTTAPELPATTLANVCYRDMFRDCTSLNYIKCLATDISATNCTQGWVAKVASTGTFVKNPNMTSWTEGNSGIPTGWTVIDA